MAETPKEIVVNPRLPTSKELQEHIAAVTDGFRQIAGFSHSEVEIYVSLEPYGTLAQAKVRIEFSWPVSLNDS